MRMRRRIVLPRCARRSLIPAASMHFHFSKWSAGLTTIPFSFHGLLQRGCFLFPAGTGTAIALMNTQRPKILHAGRWCWRSRWRGWRPDVRACVKAPKTIPQGLDRLQGAFSATKCDWTVLLELQRAPKLGALLGGEEGVAE